MSVIRELNSLADLEQRDVEDIILLADELERKKIQEGRLQKYLDGRCLAMIFDEVSLRTRSAFERASYDLGANAIYYPCKEIRLGRHSAHHEDIHDVVSVVGGFNDAILSRIYDHEIQKKIVHASPVPFINGMCDLFHPTQALCDFLTIFRRFGRISGLKIAFVGDGTNVALSLAQVASKLGANFHIASPHEMRHPQDRTVGLANLTQTESPIEAVKDAHVVVADAWTPMNKPDEAADRRKRLLPYRITVDLMRHARSDAIFLHSLPANRNEEVEPGVIDGSWSVVYEEAIARLHIARAVLLAALRPDWRGLRTSKVASLI